MNVYYFFTWYKKIRRVSTKAGGFVTQLIIIKELSFDWVNEALSNGK